MHPWWTWRSEWRTPPGDPELAPSQRLLLDPTCCGRERYRKRLELMVRSVRQVAPRALIVLKTANAICEEIFLASKRKHAMALGQAISYSAPPPPPGRPASHTR
eukprot:1145160-Prymnesium_polylepis.1